MHCSRRLLLSLLVTVSSTLHGQPLISEANDPNTPPYLDVRPQPTPQLRANLEQMQALLAELDKRKLDPEQQQAALNQLIRDHNQILRQHNTWLDWEQPQTVNSAALLLEKMIFEIAAEEIAPNKQSREQVLRNAPADLGLNPKTPEVYEPPLLSPVVPQKGRLQTDTAPKQSSQLTADQAGSAVKAPPPKPVNTQEASDEPSEADKETIVNPSDEVQVAVLADDQATVSMQDDNTVLRNVRNNRGQLVLFGKVRLWVGGAIQLDTYSGEGLFTLKNDGDSDSKTYVRRAEGILRASVFKNSEIKAQYDFEANIFRNLYWRWLSDSSDQSFTVGNQKEPIGLDYVVGSKFTTAMEPSAPSTAFASFRSKGIRYNRWATLDSEDNSFAAWGDHRTYLTGSIGLFGKDLENTNDTDWAVTSRVTVGARQTEHTGYQLGVAASYRHGEYDRIAARPGLFDVNRITLAQPNADTQAMVALEGLGKLGSLHGEMELYYSDYTGGEIDAQGWGGYGQVGWIFGGTQRPYEPRWGIWGPIHAGNKQIFEVFGRVSFTHGNDNVNSSNDLSMVTLGSNWYYRNLRLSANVILADTKRDLNDESSGQAIGLRLQYMF